MVIISSNAMMVPRQLYKCKKEVMDSIIAKDICNWTGVLQEYITHVRLNHPSSYFKPHKNEIEFEWTIPYIGDQIDICILDFNSVHFLYKIYYKGGDLKHTFTNLNGSEYRIQLNDENGQRIYQCFAEGETTSGISYKTNGRRIRWRLRLDCNYTD